MCDKCDCCHVPDNGACPEFTEGSNGRCVYCDHDAVCHTGASSHFNLPLGIGVREQTSTIYWYYPIERQPVGMQTILVRWGGIVRCGVYAKGRVSLYPEDFGTVQLSECDRWAAMPV